MLLKLSEVATENFDKFELNLRRLLKKKANEHEPAGRPTVRI